MPPASRVPAVRASRYIARSSDLKFLRADADVGRTGRTNHLQAHWQSSKLLVNTRLNTRGTTPVTQRDHTPYTPRNTRAKSLFYGGPGARSA